MRRLGKERKARKNVQRAAIGFLMQAGYTREAARAEVYGTGRVQHPTRRTLLAQSVGVRAGMRRRAHARAQAVAASVAAAEASW